MRKSRFSEERIIRMLGRVEAGKLTEDVCRDKGISENTYRRRIAKFGVMGVIEARRLKELQQENHRMKAAEAELTQEKQALKDVPSR